MMDYLNTSYHCASFGISAWSRAPVSRGLGVHPAALLSPMHTGAAVQLSFLTFPQCSYIGAIHVGERTMTACIISAIDFRIAVTLDDEQNKLTVYACLREHYQ